VIALLRHIAEHDAGEPALVVDTEVISYGELRDRVDAFAAALLGGEPDLEEERIAMLLPAGPAYVTALLGIWRAGGVAVPLAKTAAVAELEYALDAARATRLVTSGALLEKIGPAARDRGIDLVVPGVDTRTAAAALPDIEPARRALMLFTSGTTSRPKGVVTTHANIAAQIGSLIEAWRWSGDDSIPLFLPLHHIHGIVNVLCCALWAGARVDLIDGFDAETVFDRVADGRYTLFMAVPTVYVRMIAALEAMEPAHRNLILKGFANMRLMVSGSAACPVSVHEKWRALTGETLLERYGMTEIGMALSNPYGGERRPGTVGQPLPGVEVRLVAENGEDVTGENEPGEIWVRGHTVFGEYWDNPEATAREFTDGWFRTGDIADVVDGYYRILGRSSVDIIKSGGYKLSALEIEGVLLDHEGIAECAVVGLPDETWGEAVHAAIVPKPGAALDRDELQSWCRERMSNYKVPKQFHLLDALPRNAMGKVTKQAVKGLLQ
jgi:malonyl-CoA/methylmalonyl-CoA synthetase